MDYINLLGVEDIVSAANTMRDAADRMQSAANTISDSVAAANNIFLHRLEEILARDREQRNPRRKGGPRWIK